MKHGKVKLEIADHIGLITLNDPDTLNSWGQRLREDFAAAVDQVEAPEAGVRCVVLTGAGRGFSSGANLNDSDAPPRDRDAEVRGDVPTSLEAYYNPMLRRMSESVLKLLSRVGRNMDEIDLVIPHQANLRIIQAVGQRLGVASDRVFINVDRYRALGSQKQHGVFIRLIFIQIYEVGGCRV